MKKTTILTLLAAITLCYTSCGNKTTQEKGTPTQKQAEEQADKPTIAGVTFGSSREKVTEILKKKFGADKLTNDGDIIYVYDAKVGNFIFDYCTFDFQRNGKETSLSFIMFSSDFKPYETEKAAALRESIAEELKMKYNISSYTDEEGFECYKFGKHPIKKGEPLGHVVTQKMTTDEGRSLNLSVMYGPVNYLEGTEF